MHSGLDKYLQALAHELRALPEEKRDEDLREVRQHIEAIIARHVEAGAGELDAAQVAIAQFGSARKVGRQLRCASLGRESIWRAVAAPLCGSLFLFALMSAWMGAAYGVDVWLGFGPEQRSGGYQSLLWIEIAFTIVLHLLPVAEGILVGRMAPRSGVWSAPLLAAAFGVFVMATLPWGTTPQSIVEGTIPVFIGAVIGSRQMTRRAGRA